MWWNDDFSAELCNNFNSELQQLNNPQIQQFVHKWMYLAYGPLGVVNSYFELAMSLLI